MTITPEIKQDLRDTGRKVSRMTPANRPRISTLVSEYFECEKKIDPNTLTDKQWSMCEREIQKGIAAGW